MRIIQQLLGRFLDSKGVSTVLNSSVVEASRLNPFGRFMWRQIPTFVGNSLLMRITKPVVLPIASSGGQMECSPEDDHYLYLVRDGLKTWEKTTQTFFAEIAENARCVVDVGAYLGVYTIMAATTNPDCQVIAFEPNPVTFAKLQKNVALNGMDNVHIRNSANGNSSGSLSLQVPVGRPASSGATVGLGGSEFTAFEVMQVKIDDEVSEADLMKIDAEGFELQVLEGSKNLLASCHPVLILEILSLPKFADLRKFLDEFGYEDVAFLGQEDNQILATRTWIAPGNYAFMCRDGN